MNEINLTQEQKEQLKRFSFGFDLIEDRNEIVTLFQKLEEKFPNNYDFGTIIKEFFKNYKKPLINNKN